MKAELVVSGEAESPGAKPKAPERVSARMVGELGPQDPPLLFQALERQRGEVPRGGLEELRHFVWLAAGVKDRARVVHERAVRVRLAVDREHREVLDEVGDA